LEEAVSTSLIILAALTIRMLMVEMPMAVTVVTPMAVTVVTPMAVTLAIKHAA
jgi:hypothetical protein